MARIGFIGTILLRSLQTRKIFEKKFYDNFMNSIITPLTEIQNDVSDFKKKKISQKIIF